jgi:3-isopropylmalate/(R)-2-methylmalate dehydratase small subunit
MGEIVMDKFTTLTGVAAPMPIINIDTDMIIPKQYLKTIKRTGLGTALFSEMRYNEDGSEKPDFVLNKPAYRDAKIVIAGDNFGCGSSREHAPWALLDFGIRCVISTSFADIFYNNCFKNGILPIVVTPAQLELLLDDAIQIPRFNSWHPTPSSSCPETASAPRSWPRSKSSSPISTAKG